MKLSKLWLRLLALLMVACMMLGCLAACGEDEDKNRDDDDDDERTHEEEDEEEDEDEEKDDGDTAGTTPSDRTRMYILNALSFLVPADAEVTENGDDYAYFSADDYEVIAASGTLDGTAYSDEDMAEYYVDMMEGSYGSSEIRHSNGVPYAFSEVSEGLYEICSFYYNEDYDYGWTVCIYYEKEELEDLLVECAVSGTVDENYDFSSLVGDDPDEIVTQEATYEVIVYAPEDWGHIRIWAWSDTLGDLFDAWPGEKMIYNGEYYTIDIPTWADCVVINGMNGDIQTEDIYVGTWDAVWIVIAADSSYYEIFFEEPTAADLEDMGY